MGKRRRPQETELPFVALMDTMTNVVGVLVIVLVMIGISLANAVNKAFSDLPPVTKAQVQAAQSALDAVRKSVSAVLEKLKAIQNPDLSQSKLAALDAEIARLEKEIQAKGIKLVDTSSLLKTIEALEKELAAAKELAVAKAKEIEKLKAQLAAIPVVKQPDAKLVRLPDSRPVPPGSKMEYFLADANGITYYDADGASDTYKREFQLSTMRQNEFQRVKQGNLTKVIYDQKKTANYFSSRTLQSRNFLLTPAYHPTSTVSAIIMVPKPGAGEPVSQLNAINSQFQNALRKIRFNPKAVVMFKVTKDGFESYLAAREVVDKLNVPAGWDFASDTSHRFNVPDISFNQLEKPAPKPTPNPNAPPPKKLAPTID